MLLSIVQLSLRSIRWAKFLKPVDLRSTVKCGYGKWMSRRPTAIVNEYELYNTDDTTKVAEEKPKTRRKRPRSTRKEKGKDKKNEIKESSAKEQKYIALDADDKLIRYIIF